MSDEGRMAWYFLQILNFEPEQIMEMERLLSTPNTYDLTLRGLEGWRQLMIDIGIIKGCGISTLHRVKTRASYCWYQLRHDTFMDLVCGWLSQGGRSEEELEDFRATIRFLVQKDKDNKKKKRSRWEYEEEEEEEDSNGSQQLDEEEDPSSLHGNLGSEW
jgi:hypothetical protein